MAKPKQNRLLVFLRDKQKKNYFKIFKEFVNLLLIKKEVPFYYFKYLYRKDITNYKDYVSTKEAYRIKYKDTFHKEEYLTIISNKLSFSIYCDWNGLPVPSLLSHNFESNFYYKGNHFKINDENELIDFFGMVLDKSEKDSLFIKPLSMYGGTGCFRISKENLNIDLLECAEFIMQNGCIHEEAVIQNEEINKIHSGCINTMRVETFIDKKGEIHILSAFMRFGIGKSHVDNAHSGGFYVGINLKNGTLRDIGHQYMEYGGAKYTIHPDSKFAFANFEIPYFKELCDLVIKGVQFLPDRYIGWDIAISNKGPVIIEANEYPSIFMADIAYGGYLKHPLYKGIIEEVS